MTTLQIIALSVIGAGILVAIGFFVAFLVEISKKEKAEDAPAEVVETPAEVEESPEVTEIDIDAMLAKLEENSAKNAPVVEAVEETPADETALEPEVVAEETTTEEPVVEEQPAETAEEVAEEPVALKEAVTVEEQTTEDAPVVETVEETPAEVVTEEKEEEPKTTVIIKKIVKEGPEFDYRVRLEKIKDSEEKLEKDLDKTLKAITKYERTERRLARNQKLLDRKAGELANLNLLMYNVTDIKNVDEEKKARQEELVAHISELKASIEDAEKYLSANAEKHANNIKLRDYLLGEQVRYKEELSELEVLIAQAEGRAPTTTVETTVEEVPVDAAPAADDENPADDGDQE